jgi:hypothetical protein
VSKPKPIAAPVRAFGRTTAVKLAAAAPAKVASKAAPNARAYARANANASFKRTASPALDASERGSAKNVNKLFAQRRDLLEKSQALAPKPAPAASGFDLGKAIGDFIGSRNDLVSGKTPSTISNAMKAAPNARKVINGR